MGAQRTAPDALNYSKWADSRSAPVHEVTVEPFFLSKYEVTQDQWTRFVGNNPSEFTPANPHSHSSPLVPVEQVSWTDCDEFTRRQGLMLPSEEQWEYSARAGTNTIWWTGNEEESLHGAGNLADLALARNWGYDHEAWDDGAMYTAIIGSYAANPFGLHDVLGNVDEWCRDPWHPYDSKSQPTGAGQSTDEAPTTRMSRGGSFLAPARGATSARRVDSTPDARPNSYGLRPARALSTD